MKHWRLLILGWMLSALLVFSVYAETTTETVTDENGHTVTIVTDENGNQTIIEGVEPGDDDITFDDGELDLDEEEGPTDSTQPEPSAETAAPSGEKTGVPGWIWPVIVAALAACALVVVRVLRRGTKA